MGGSTTSYVEVVLADHILESAYVKLKDAAKRNFEAPQVYLQKTFGKKKFTPQFCEIITGGHVQSS